MNEQYCTFDLDGVLVGVAIDRVEEVRSEQTITPVPRAHPDVAGLLNLRGQIVTAIDGRRRLGLTERTVGSTIVVIHSLGEAVGLLVDRVGEVVDVEDRALEEVPDTVSSDIRALCRGAYQLDGNRLLLVLDPDKTLAVTS